MTGRPLWPFALEVYARPGAEALLLELQDEHGQCVVYLLWCLWMALEGRRADEAALDAGAARARTWEAEVTGPLRELRRRLRMPLTSIAGPSLEALRRKLGELELEAERGLLADLETLSLRSAAFRGRRRIV